MVGVEMGEQGGQGAISRRRRQGPVRLPDEGSQRRQVFEQIDHQGLALRHDLQAGPAEAAHLHLVLRFLRHARDL